VLGIIANDVAPLLVGGVNICDNQHQNLTKSLGFEWTSKLLINI
jgi:hypothetical protein